LLGTDANDGEAIAASIAERIEFPVEAYEVFDVDLTGARGDAFRAPMKLYGRLGSWKKFERNIAVALRKISRLSGGASKKIPSKAITIRFRLASACSRDELVTTAE
jgi:hypothetical protein